jgi:hypothetical protein
MYLLATLFLAPAFSSGNTVAEWKFDETEPLTTDGIIKIQQTPSKASDESILRNRTEYKPEPTEIGSGWASYLQTGYLDVARDTNTDDEAGLMTRNTSSSKNSNFGYSKYMGFKGLGKGNDGGTVCLVFSPKSDWYKAPGNRTLFGTGMLPGNVYTTAGWILLGYKFENVFHLVLGQGDGTVAQLSTSTISPKDMELKKDRWYFVAGSWKEAADPVLYLREMKSGGPAMSPKAEIGKTGGKPLEKTTEPSESSLCVGALVGDSGFVQRTTYGADARIAYARLDNEYMDAEKMEKIFLSLGN